MKKLSTFCHLLLITVLSYSDAQAASSDAAVGMACGGFLFFIALIIVINIAILVWVTKDAKARGMGSPMGWLIFVAITGPLGMIIYLFSRPSGEIVACSNCRNRRLKAMSKCPHCGN